MSSSKMDSTSKMDESDEHMGGGVLSRPSSASSFTLDLSPSLSTFTHDLSLFTNMQFVDFDPIDSNEMEIGDGKRMNGNVENGQEEFSNKEEISSLMSVPDTMDGNDGYSCSSLYVTNLNGFQGNNKICEEKQDSSSSVSGSIGIENDVREGGEVSGGLTEPMNSGLFGTSDLSMMDTEGKMLESISSATLRKVEVKTQARIAAELDKRRRNTAASARFRLKKKLREQEIERTAREMTEQVAILNTRVKHLEMENEWLRSLIVDKYSNAGNGGGGGKGEVGNKNCAKDEKGEWRSNRAREKGGGSGTAVVVIGSKVEIENIRKFTSNMDGETKEKDEANV